MATPRSAPAVNAAGTSWGMSVDETLSGAAPAFRRTVMWTLAAMRLRM
ncbi:hypothetical protein [Streptomyces sp. SID12501]|uniref:Uncharacterized protein n=1 Tax=Streptomyces sp. SID12501 TaxID=2706042 RepID=A0A6B3C5Z9_9ACTN|nr:hypothetical protein [Streptomyces sp. SID12501]NEC92237.1 hypothetical protein [Streptomyces sp. SID12501]